MGRNYSYDKLEYIKKQKETHLGQKHPKWKGGNSRCYNYNRFVKPLIVNMVQKCSLCGSTNKLLAHHLDGNYKNNVLENITIVCRSCHNKIHKTKNRRIKI